MCSIVILKQSDSEWPLIIGANRDEMNNRDSLPPGRHWKDRPHICAGKDLIAGGTWIGINDFGVVAAVMNRMNSLGPLKNKRSRGELVLDALDHADSSEALNAIIDIEKDSYRGFNMFIADNLNAYWVKSEEKQSVIEYFNIPDGLSIITAYDRNDLNSKRIKTYLSKFALASDPKPGANEWLEWEILLGSTYSESNDPLAAMCVKTDMGFQTVSSTLMALPSLQTKISHLKPVYKFANGSPDSVGFTKVKI